MKKNAVLVCLVTALFGNTVLSQPTTAEAKSYCEGACRAADVANDAALAFSGA